MTRDPISVFAGKFPSGQWITQPSSRNAAMHGGWPGYMSRCVAVNHLWSQSGLCEAEKRPERSLALKIWMVRITIGKKQTSRLNCTAAVVLPLGFEPKCFQDKQGLKPRLNVNMATYNGSNDLVDGNHTCKHWMHNLLCSPKSYQEHVVWLMF